VSGLPRATWTGRHGPRGRIRSVKAAGQSLVEFAFVVPVFLLILLGMLEFGIAFTHDQTLAYATREGARTGAALASGNTTYPCTTPNFDAPIVAAVQRVLKSTGSPIDINRITSLNVYLAKNDGTATTSVNTWVLAPGGGPVVDGKALDFKETTTGWSPCSRNNGVGADGLGVSLVYDYKFQTSLSGIMRFMFGTAWSSLTMSDKTVMNLNPTAQ
jgi:Flp pilus assembly protein TadG